MASMTMTASFLGGSAAAISKQLPTTTGSRRGALMVKASKMSEGENFEMKNEEESSRNGRRELVFAAAAAAAAACSLAKAALAGGGEPKRGTPEAKKKYAPICVTMPTAKICHK